MKIESNLIEKPKKTFMPIALAVTGDEPALFLQEVNLMSPDNKDLHRYQVIGVIRNDKQYEFRRDLGLAKNWVGIRQINIPSFLEHTVDELIELAEHLRHTTKIDIMDWLELDKAKIK